MAIDGQPTGTSLPGIRIPPGGTAVFSTTPGGSQLLVGMVKFTSDNRAGGVVKFIFAGGQVGVLSSEPQSSGILVLNTKDGNDVGVGIANPGPDPINIHLTQLDENGSVLETLDPPEMNPLAPNGQIARVATQFGFRQIANRDRGSIRMAVQGMGAFSAFALLLKDDAFSSTAIVPGDVKFAPTFNATYTGAWNGQSTGNSGTIGIQTAVDTATRTVTGTVTVTGDIFDSGSPGGSASFAGSYSHGMFQATGTSSLFGPATLSVNYMDGSLSLTADSLPYYDVCTFSLTGNARLDQIIANYLITYDYRSDAKGTVTLWQGSINLK